MVDRDCHLQKVWALDWFARAILLCHLRVTKKLEEEKEFAEKQAVYGHTTHVLCDLGVYWERFWSVRLTEATIKHNNLE